MRIFLSWSGPLSKAYAEAFRDFIALVIQAVDPYFSPDDIEKGSKWSTEISTALRESKVGVFFLTRENLNSEWLHYEAGAISNVIESSRVCPLLFGVSTSDVVGPLSQFQLTEFSKEEIRKFVSVINLQMPKPLDMQIYNKSFDNNWRNFEELVQSIANNALAAPKVPKRSEKDILEEILQISRALNNKMPRNRGILSDDLLVNIAIDLNRVRLILSDIVAHIEKEVSSGKDEDKYISRMLRELVMIIQNIVQNIDQDIIGGNNSFSDGGEQKLDVLRRRRKGV
jgi:hypothetical protein